MNPPSLTPPLGWVDLQWFQMTLLNACLAVLPFAGRAEHPGSMCLFFSLLRSLCVELSDVQRTEVFQHLLPCVDYTLGVLTPAPSSLDARLRAYDLFSTPLSSEQFVVAPALEHPVHCCGLLEADRLTPSLASGIAGASFDPVKSELRFVSGHESTAFAVLDLGLDIILTDVVIPMNGTVEQLTVDVWQISEKRDNVRLTLGWRLGERSLVLTNLLQPCRFLKLVLVGSRTTPQSVVIDQLRGLPAPTASSAAMTATLARVDAALTPILEALRAATRQLEATTAHPPRRLQGSNLAVLEVQYSECAVLAERASDLRAQQRRLRARLFHEDRSAGTQATTAAHKAESVQREHDPAHYVSRPLAATSTTTTRTLSSVPAFNTAAAPSDASGAAAKAEIPAPSLLEMHAGEGHDHEQSHQGVRSLLRAEIACHPARQIDSELDYTPGANPLAATVSELGTSSDSRLLARYAVVALHLAELLPICSVASTQDEQMTKWASKDGVMSLDGLVHGLLAGPLADDLMDQVLQPEMVDSSLGVITTPATNEAAAAPLAVSAVPEAATADSADMPPLVSGPQRSRLDPHFEMLAAKALKKSLEQPTVAESGRTRWRMEILVRMAYHGFGGRVDELARLIVASSPTGQSLGHLLFLLAAEVARTPERRDRLLYFVMGAFRDVSLHIKYALVLTVMRNLPPSAIGVDWQPSAMLPEAATPLAGLSLAILAGHPSTDSALSDPTESIATLRIAVAALACYRKDLVPEDIWVSPSILLVLRSPSGPPPAIFRVLLSACIAGFAVGRAHCGPAGECARTLLEAMLAPLTDVTRQNQVEDYSALDRDLRDSLKACDGRVVSGKCRARPEPRRWRGRGDVDRENDERYVELCAGSDSFS